MPHPVGGIERLLVGEPGPGDVRDARDRGPVDGDAARRLSELAGDRLDFGDDELDEIDRYATESDINIWAESSRV